jgi:adenylate cyclase
VWAERYDRDASDIFAIQDEISQAIVKALKLNLLPSEKRAILHRGTENVEAYNLYLMARQAYVSSQDSNTRSANAIIRLCARSTEIDPHYAQAWALMAVGYMGLREAEGGTTETAMQAVDRALELNSKLAEAHAVKARVLEADADVDAAVREVTAALELDPESYEVNRAAGRIIYHARQYANAVRYLEKAASLMETDLYSLGALISCYTELHDASNVRRVAQLAVKRAEAILERDSNNADMMAYSAYALAALGENERAKARMNHASLIDPGNANMRYNFACALSVLLNDNEAALDMMSSVFERITEAFLSYAKADPDLSSLHDDPRWLAMVAKAEARLAAGKSMAPETVTGS